jgi:hypothetical protein
VVKIQLKNSEIKCKLISQNGCSERNNLGKHLAEQKGISKMEVIEKPRITNRSEKKELVRRKGSPMSDASLVLTWPQHGAASRRIMPWYVHSK